MSTNINRSLTYIIVIASETIVKLKFVSHTGNQPGGLTLIITQTPILHVGQKTFPPCGRSHTSVEPYDQECIILSPGDT